jgi:hypothetical protein
MNNPVDDLLRISTPATDSLPPPLRLWHLSVGGFVISSLIVLAGKLQIADLLDSGPKTCDELARLTGTHAPSLYRILRALASEGIFHEVGPGMFTQSRLSEFLRTDIPGSMRNLTATFLDPALCRSFSPEEVEYSLRTGKPAFEKVAGKSFFEHFSGNAIGADFHKAMTDMSTIQSPAIAAAYDFSQTDVVCDIGGGYGHLIGTILESNPQVSGVLFDAPVVIEQARSAPAKEILRSRCQFISGNFFDAVPAGARTYIMKWILHDWDDDRARMLLSNVRKVISSDGRLLIADSVVPPGNFFEPSKLMDIIMLVGLSGLERTEAQFRDLLVTTGFRLTRVIPTKCPLSIVEAAPA